MKTEEFKIEGMTCGHCVMTLKKGLSGVSGVKVEDVQIGTARIQYDESRVSVEDVRKAIEEAGYLLHA